MIAFRMKGAPPLPEPTPRKLVHRRIQAIHLARMWSAGLVQVKGLGSALCSAM